MAALTRRELLKSGIAASATSLVPGISSAAESQRSQPNSHPSSRTSPDGSVRTSRERLLLDSDWRFALGNADDPDKDFEWGKLERGRTFAKSGNVQPATAKLDTSGWSIIDLPHDWAVELPFAGTPPLPDQGGHPLGREYPATSIGWYRKSFDLDPKDKGKRIQIEFEGVYRNCVVFLNGHYIYNNFSGYAPFVLDITDWINLDKPNLLTVRVDATLGAGWFYEGAGIYRHVWLIKSGPVHLVEWGTYIRSEVKGRSARIDLGSEVANDSDQPVQASVEWHLLDAAGTAVTYARSETVSIPPWGSHTFQAQTSLRDPDLWSLESPALYRTVATVRSPHGDLDSEISTFGIRTAHFDPDKGFFLNGKPVRIYGTCCHQDHAGLGAALPDRVQYYRIERLKAMSSNALRTSHNPPAPALMDATDSLGMLVMCETRMMDSSPEGLNQLERMIRRFRNHPSIILWSLGNEEVEQGTERGAKIVSTMRRLARRLDPTRPATVAMSGGWGAGASEVVDVQGFNYNYGQMDKFHKDFPKMPCVGSETAAVRYTRGAYENDKDHGYIKSYDDSEKRSAAQWWTLYDERPWLAGAFEWTGFDYRGEPKPYAWPNVISQSGSMDLCGFPKDIFYYYKSWWSADPVLHLFPHWNWPESKHGQPIDIWCYTNLESVELFLNGSSQGEQKVARNTHAQWKVPYTPGVIEVRGSRNGTIVLTDKRETVGPPAKIVLSPDRSTIAADGADVSMITVEVQDAQGRTVPTADDQLAFQVAGPGRLIGLGNGCPTSHEPDKGTTRKAFMGLAQAIVQSLFQPGTITVHATAPGLQSATIEIASDSVERARAQ